METLEVVMWCLLVPVFVMMITYYTLKDAKFPELVVPEKKKYK
jgi:hypothetical protein